MNAICFKFMWYLCLFTSETEFVLIDIVAVLHSLNWIVLIEVLTAIALLFLYSSFSGTIQILYHLAFSAKIKHKLFALWVVWNVKLKNALIFKCSDQKENQKLVLIEWLGNEEEIETFLLSAS